MLMESWGERKQVVKKVIVITSTLDCKGKPILESEGEIHSVYQNHHTVIKSTTKYYD